MPHIMSAVCPVCKRCVSAYLANGNVHVASHPNPLERLPDGYCSGSNQVGSLSSLLTPYGATP